MKLIDADALKKEIAEYIEVKESNWEYGQVTGLEIAWSCADEAPAIDAVQVVRCKDCKHGDWYTTAEGKCFCYCTIHGSSAHTVEDFCSYGERKDDD